jgi:hypothetical protein
MTFQSVSVGAAWPGLTRWGPRVLAGALVFFSGCAELRSGWVRIEFPEGKIRPIMVCAIGVDKDRNLTGECISIPEVARRLKPVPVVPPGDM